MINLSNHLTCPCPREIDVSFLENLISSANLYKSAAGSVPVDNTNTRGVVGDDSLKDTDRSAVCGSMNRWPRLAETKSWGKKKKNYLRT